MNTSERNNKLFTKTRWWIVDGSNRAEMLPCIKWCNFREFKLLTFGFKGNVIQLMACLLPENNHLKLLTRFKLHPQWSISSRFKLQYKTSIGYSSLSNNTQVLKLLHNG